MKKKPRVIAYYLPQFHVIPENNKWWGDGFTEWTNVKKAKPLFRGHRQPRVPLANNYYNLEDSSVMQWQAKIAKENGIDGFCYYHYWFNGKLLLQKPLENMLVDHNVDIQFCFSWANEPWARTWDGRDTDVLMPQTYGGEKEWQEHFAYLIRFFNDARYIKVDNKPMMVIYRASNIPDFSEMVKYWDKLCVLSGFNGIHVVETLNSREKEPISSESKAAVEFEPSFTLYHNYAIKYRLFDWIRRKVFGINIQKYDNIYSCILRRRVSNDTKSRYLGAFVSWDNSPRKGRNALIVEGASPSKFSKYFELLYRKALNNNCDFIFVNAWNEWAEGTYLEPDVDNEYSYLQSIKMTRDIF